MYDIATLLFRIMLFGTVRTCVACVGSQPKKWDSMGGSVPEAVSEREFVADLP